MTTRAPRGDDDAEERPARRFVHTDVITAYSAWCSPSTPEAYVRALMSHYPIGPQTEEGRDPALALADYVEVCGQRLRSSERISGSNREAVHGRSAKGWQVREGVDSGSQNAIERFLSRNAFPGVDRHQVLEQDAQRIGRRPNVEQLRHQFFVAARSAVIRCAAPGAPWRQARPQAAIRKTRLTSRPHPCAYVA